MLAVVEPGRVDEVVAACRRWDLDATADRDRDRGREPGGAVRRRGGGGPAGPPAGRRGSGLRGAARPGARRASRSTWRPLPEPDDLAGAWLALLARPSLASKRWIYERYDHLVGANTIRRPGGDAAVVRLPGSERAIALTTDCAERHCELDPRGGGRASVLEAARNLACVGARPVAATDCLNFANPEKGSTGWRLEEAIAGMSDALRALGVPVVSGNVSLYNESASRAILPTPVVGMMGLLERADASVGHAFVAEGDALLLLGDDGVIDGCGVPGAHGGQDPRRGCGAGGGDHRARDPCGPRGHPAQRPRRLRRRSRRRARRERARRRRRGGAARRARPARRRGAVRRGRRPDPGERAAGGRGPARRAERRDGGCRSASRRWAPWAERTP